MKEAKGGASTVSDSEAACALAMGHPKCKPVPVKWTMKSQQDDDARKQSFDRGARL